MSTTGRIAAVVWLGNLSIHSSCAIMVNSIEAEVRDTTRWAGREICTLPNWLVRSQPNVLVYYEARSSDDLEDIDPLSNHLSILEPGVTIAANARHLRPAQYFNHTFCRDLAVHYAFAASSHSIYPFIQMNMPGASNSKSIGTLMYRYLTAQCPSTCVSSGFVHEILSHLKIVQDTREERLLEFRNRTRNTWSRPWLILS